MNGQPAAPEPPAGNDSKDFTKVTLGITALLGALGSLALTGLLGRAQRNHPGWFLASLFLVTAAGVFWVIAAVTSTKAIRISRRQPSAKALGISALLVIVGVVLFAREDGAQHWVGLAMFAVVAVWWAAHIFFGEEFELNTWRAQVVAVVLFGAGLLAGFCAVMLTQQDVERPFVSATLDPASLKLTGTVTVANLGSEEHLRLFVEGLVTDPESGDVVDQKLLYKGFLGPDSEGKVSAPIDVTVPAGTYGHIGIRAWTDKDDGTCTDYVVAEVKKRAAGCVMIPVPPRSGSPTVLLAWAQDASALTVEVKSRNSALPVGVRVTGIGSPDGDEVSLSSFVFYPDDKGTITTSQTVYPPEGIDYVCAEARFIEEVQKAGRASGCPLGFDDFPRYNAIAQIAIPARTVDGSGDQEEADQGKTE